MIAISRILAIGLTLLGLAAPQVIAQPPAVARTIIHAGHVIAEPGQPALHKQSLIIENGRFAAIEPGYIEADNAIDLRDRWLVPGLIDLHTHVTVEIFDRSQPPAQPVIMLNLERPSKTVLSAAVRARQLLQQGFTTVRNVGDPAGVLFDLRDAINQGMLPGPRIFGTQSQIVVSGGDYDPVAFGALDKSAHALMDRDGICSGADDCRRAVRREIRSGADVIKMRISGAGSGIGPNDRYESREELKSIIDTAHSLSRTVAVHSHSPAASALVLELGADTIEHGLPAARDYKAFKHRKGINAYFVPTLTAMDAVRDMMLKMTGKDWYAEAEQQLGEAYRAGVPIAFGTDAGAFPHDQAYREFALMAAAGLSNEDVLRAATVNAADALRKSDQLGSIAPGKWADVIALGGNPLEDIKHLEQPVFIMKAGIEHTSTN